LESLLIAGVCNYELTHIITIIDNPPIPKHHTIPLIVSIFHRVQKKVVFWRF